MSRADHSSQNSPGIPGKYRFTGLESVDADTRRIIVAYAIVYNVSAVDALQRLVQEAVSSTNHPFVRQLAQAMAQDESSLGEIS